MANTNYSWKRYTNTYFPGEGGIGGYYADSNDVMAPIGKIVLGVKFYAKGNRIAPALLCAQPDGSGLEWVKNGDFNGNYFPGEGGIGGYYADSNEVLCPTGKYVKGISIYPKGNRIALRLYCGDNIHNDEGIWVKNDNPNHYFPGEGGIGGYYCDSNPVTGWVPMRGVGIVPSGNRIALQINTILPKED